TALADVVRFKGLPLSEPMCFGLGAGLAFYYLPSGEGPSRVFYGRTATMEEDFCRLLGLGFLEQTEPDERLAWERVREKVDANDPVILSTDLRYLPYYRTRTAFNGHRVVLAGYDAERGTALLADTEREGLQEIALADLARARTSDGPPAGLQYSPWWEISVAHGARSPGDAAPEALALAARRALEDVTGFGGCDALARMADELPRWRDLPDLPAVARAGYQMIEKRGTGGALFSRLYARFLDELSRAAPALPVEGLGLAMHRLADDWTALALALRDVAEGAGALPRCAGLAQRLADGERAFFEELRGRFS
ncbi:MAG: BtrH N-terminal domain-containing protein, partial [Myxococcales bacterium]